jgi:hypothetical protein
MRLVGILILPAFGIGAIVRICTEINDLQDRVCAAPMAIKMVPAEGVAPSLTAF